jgi:hypothetical protein
MESPVTIPMRRTRLFSEATLKLLAATGVVDVIFCPSLLTSRDNDVGLPVATMPHGHYSDGLNSAIATVNRFAWLLCLFIVVIGLRI